MSVAKRNYLIQYSQNKKLHNFEENHGSEFIANLKL